MFTAAAVGAWLSRVVQPDAGAGEVEVEVPQHPVAGGLVSHPSSFISEEKGGKVNPKLKTAINTAAQPAAQHGEPPYTLTYVAPELPPADADWIAAAQRRKMLDRSATIMAVASRDAASGAPVVLQLYPLRTTDHALRKGKAPGGGSKNKWSSRAATPWPNLFWLMGPEIQVRVGRLEHLGLIKSFRAKLQNNPELKQRFDADHRKYAELRWSLLTPEDQKYALECGYDDALRECGIGGVKYTLQVKCLHVHYAHFLATGQNLVGEWVQAALDENLDLQTKGK